MGRYLLPTETRTQHCFHYAKEAAACLQAFGLQTIHYQFEMGHQIIPEELQELNNWQQ